MSPFEPLQPDNRQFVIADTRTIALIASKKNFNIDVERKRIEKARVTRSLCRHWTGTEICMYRNCRHSDTTHFRGGA